MMIKQQSCFYCNILLYQPLCSTSLSTSLTETSDVQDISFTDPIDAIFYIYCHDAKMLKEIRGEQP